MSRNFVLASRVKANSPLMTSKHDSVSSLVKDFNGLKRGWFYEKFITEVDDNGKPIREIITLKNGVTSTCDEWCSECDSEVVLPSKFEVHKCPECGKEILPCNLCYENAVCSECPLLFDEFNFVELF